MFYLYQSVWTKVTADEEIVCKIDNPMMLKQSKLAYDRQATVFDTLSNVYAPYYRQVDEGSTLKMLLEEQQNLIKGVPL